MKVKELVKVIPPKTDIAFEIIEDTFPEGYYSHELLDKFPSSAECEIIWVSPSIAYDTPQGTPSLHVEASSKLTRVEIDQMSSVEKLRYCGYTEEQILKIVEV